MCSPRTVVFVLLFLWLFFGGISSAARAEGPRGLTCHPNEAASDPRQGGERADPPHEESAWTRWELVAQRPASGETRFYLLPIEWVIRFFQRFVSPVDGPSCDFSPTCSAYGMKAVDKHGMVGVPMATERIMRNHHPDNPARYPLVEQGEELYFADPVEANDFWW